jgi:hypothetical protein
MNFGKHFSKTMRAKLEFQGYWKKHGGRRENFIINIKQLMCDQENLED